MSRALLVCVSVWQGNTAKVAEAMAEVLHADIREPEQADPATLERYDVIGFGSGIFWWSHHARLRRFIEGLPQVDGIAAFVFTTAHMGRSQSLPWQPSLDAILRRKGYDVVGSFACEGTDPWMPQRLIPGLYRAHPDDGDLERARRFAEQVAARVESGGQAQTCRVDDSNNTGQRLPAATGDST